MFPNQDAVSTFFFYHFQIRNYKNRGKKLHLTVSHCAVPSVATLLGTPVQSNTIQYTCSAIKSTFMIFVDTVIEVLTKCNVFSIDVIVSGGAVLD